MNPNLRQEISEDTEDDDLSVTELSGGELMKTAEDPGVSVANMFNVFIPVLSVPGLGSYCLSQINMPKQTNIDKLIKTNLYSHN